MTILRSPVVVLMGIALLAGPVVRPEGRGQAPRGWPQFGGPQRNFVLDVKDLAASWPADGPAQVWKRALGDGFAPIAVVGDMLYTMYQRGEFELVVAMDADTGITIWQHPYLSPVDPNVSPAHGSRATPLVLGDAVYSVGANGKLHRLNRHDGKVDWRHDLFAAFRGAAGGASYAASPLAVGDTIILPAGGNGAGVVAFDQRTGNVAWKALGKRVSRTSPILIDVDGHQQVVLGAEQEVIGVDPRDGRPLWSHPHANGTKNQVSAPIPGDDNLLFVSSGDGGSRMLSLVRKRDDTLVEELWHRSDLKLYAGNAVRVGDTLYGSTGDSGQAVFAALDVKTGRTRWQQPNVPKSSVLYADGKFVLLTEDGELMLAAPRTNGLGILARAQVLTKPAWTPPSLVGERLYLRDRTHALALELK